MLIIYNKNMTKYKNKTIFLSFKFAFRGIFLVLKSQQNFRLGVIISLFAIIFGILLKLSFVELAIIIIAASFVLFAELANTVIEFVVDAYFKNNYSKIAGMSKDIAAGTVLLAVFNFVIVGALLFLPKLIILFK